VEFLDGTCADVFFGCTNSFFFAFDDLLEARDASWALADQIFLDGASGAFDSNPALTRGCEDAAECSVHAPHALLNSVEVGTTFVRNSSAEEFDIRDSTQIIRGLAMSSPSKTWARWRPVPEPGSNVMATAALVTLGVLVRVHRTRGALGLAARRRTRALAAVLPFASLVGAERASAARPLAQPYQRRQQQDQLKAHPTGGHSLDRVAALYRRAVE
jgi:hypothetical protein